jgi:hypothetical protein
MPRVAVNAAAPNGGVQSPRYPPWAIAPNVNAMKLIAMPIATFASIDKSFMFSLR